ncbi:kinase suppressor of Ras 1-like [Montipora foliosa]|uniref:kinase suppressor of Ras 1-like n=1 Tax=Montipora foliosa TaxID=591990 RepID=UPI0035F1BF88
MLRGFSCQKALSSHLCKHATTICFLFNPVRMQADVHSFSRTILCRSQCDKCKKVIRFLGVRCQDCRLKYHRKCLSFPCPADGNFRCCKVDAEKTTAKRFWRKKHDASGKIAIRHANLQHFARKGTERSLLPLNATGKFRQKLINGIYESFCYSTRQAFEFQANDVDEFRLASRPLVVSVERHSIPEKYPTHICENLTTIDEPLLASPRSIKSEHLIPSSTWHRVNSWSTSVSYTNSSGYSSANTSCPSSANSHRSSSPTPDFSNIRLLRSTLEQYEAEEHYDSRESDLGIPRVQDDIAERKFLVEPFDSFATWPQKSRNLHNAEKANKRIFSVDNFQRSPLHKQKPTANKCLNKKTQDEENIKKSLREWSIPFSDLQVGEIVGVGPKGNVHKGRWHGDIMIHTRRKSTKEDMEEFLKEVSVLSMIRHENIVLFMGACLEPPNLAVITSVRRGLSLYNHLHVRQDHFSLHSKISIAKQIAQGMSYLHAKGIVLPALTAMNVFLESKVKLCVSSYCNRTTRVEREGYASIPQGHLAYLAPELMRTLTRKGCLLSPEERNTEWSNVYAFSTILYEICSGKWPFSSCPTHSVIWMIGQGQQQCVTHLHSPESLKELIRNCWSEIPSERPGFRSIADFLQQQNFPPEVSRKRISFSEPEKMNVIGRKMDTLSIK